MSDRNETTDARLGGRRWIVWLVMGSVATGAIFLTLGFLGVQAFFSVLRTANIQTSEAVDAGEDQADFPEATGSPQPAVPEYTPSPPLPTQPETPGIGSAQPPQQAPALPQQSPAPQQPAPQQPAPTQTPEACPSGGLQVGAATVDYTMHNESLTGDAAWDSLRFDARVPITNTSPHFITGTFSARVEGTPNGGTYSVKVFFSGDGLAPGQTEVATGMGTNLRHRMPDIDSWQLRNSSIIAPWYYDLSEVPRDCQYVAVLPPP